MLNVKIQRWMSVCHTSSYAGPSRAPQSLWAQPRQRGLQRVCQVESPELSRSAVTGKTKVGARGEELAIFSVADEGQALTVHDLVAMHTIEFESSK